MAPGRLPGSMLCAQTAYNRAQSSIFGEHDMGKGDKRTRRGKINNGSYGKSRPGKDPKKADAADSKKK